MDSKHLALLSMNRFFVKFHTCSESLSCWKIHWCFSPSFFRKLLFWSQIWIYCSSWSEPLWLGWKKSSWHNAVTTILEFFFIESFNTFLPTDQRIDDQKLESFSRWFLTKVRFAWSIGTFFSHLPCRPI